MKILIYIYIISFFLCFVVNIINYAFNKKLQKDIFDIESYEFLESVIGKTGIDILVIIIIFCMSLVPGYNIYNLLKKIVKFIKYLLNKIKEIICKHQ